MRYKRFYNINFFNNYTFFNNFFYFLKNLEKNLLIFYFLKNNFIKYNITPNFMFNKKIFYDYFNFIKFTKKNNLKFLNIKNSNFYNLNYNFYGNNLLLFSNKNIEDKDLILIKNDYNLDLFFKNNFDFLENKFDITYFLNFNLFFLNIIEIYKILILLNLNIITK